MSSGSLTPVAAECLLAALVGLIAARLFRRHRLHWSWTVGPVAIAFSRAGLLHHAALPIGLGALSGGLGGSPLSAPGS